MNKLFIKKIKQYDSIIIAKHISPDWDAQGSAVGLAYIIKQNFKNKNIYVVGDILQEHEFNRDEHLTDDIISESLLITVDTANKARVEFGRIDLVKEIIKFDHHLVSEQYANYQIVINDAAACTQVITLWAKEMNLTINQDAAYNLYKGLITDSGRFLFDMTKELTFEAAKILVSTGISLPKIYDELYLLDLKTKQWLNYAFGLMQISNNQVGHIYINKDIIKKWNLDYDTAKMALNQMAGMIDVKIWVGFIEWKDEIRVSMRSRDFDVVKVAKQFNGGGHRLASGAKIEHASDYKKVVSALDELIKKG